MKLHRLNFGSSNVNEPTNSNKAAIIDKMVRVLSINITLLFSGRHFQQMQNNWQKAERVWLVKHCSLDNQDKRRFFIQNLDYTFYCLIVC